MVHYYRDVLVRVQDHSSLNSQDQEAKWQTREVQVQLPVLHLHHSALVWHYFTTAVPLFFFFFFENSIFKSLVWVNLSQIECREYWSTLRKYSGISSHISALSHNAAIKTKDLKRKLSNYNILVRPFPGQWEGMYNLGWANTCCFQLWK